MRKRLLYERLQNLNDRGFLRFHMPGHKGRESLRNEGWRALDFTEVPGADNLHHPEDIILEVQEKLASIYGSEVACILVGGTTNGLQSAVMGVCHEGDSLLIPTNCHRSIYAGLALGRIKGVYFSPKWDETLGIGKTVTPEQVKDQLEKHPEVKGMVLVNPTYYGTTSDVQEIAAVLHRAGKILIVDEAHGAHLKFCEAMPMDGVSAGADIVVQSTHKLLGALTQSSLLHMQGKRVDQVRVKKFLSVLQSSSPSYLLMMSVEDAVEEAAEKGNAVFSAIAEAWDHYRQNEGQDQVMTLYAPEDGTPYDKSKWLFRVKQGLGTQLEERLRLECGIQCELSAKNHVLAMTGIGTTPEDLQRLIKGVKKINETTPLRGKEEESVFFKNDFEYFDYNEVIPLWEALYNRPLKAVPLKQAAGKIAGDFIIPYPPGIPVLLPGNVMTKEMAAALTERIENGEVVVGVDHKNAIFVIDD